MISLILPYWDRQEAADKAFELLAKHYADLDLEVVVVDDGNAVPFRVPDVPLNIQVVRLPRKDHPTPQSKAWNAGVEAASYEIIVLSCVEVLHENPVLPEMLKRLRHRDDYILAATYCPELKEWQVHSEVELPTLPKGVGPAFCGMMTKELFYRAGGFDEAYHYGAGWEDKDFIQRMLKAGAKFQICDDLVTIHPKTGATISWPVEGFERNEAIYRTRWFKPVTFLCLKAGDMYGPEYANILFDMVRRNLSHGYPGRFVCLTDDPEGLDPAIETIPLPSGLEGWWGKLYMFKRGLFSEGERIVFLDLDTVIVGGIDWLAGYDGQFATLRDFYYPQQVGPAIIAWEAGDFASSIWEEWESCGKPKNGHGDLWWINNLDQGRFVKEIDILQDKFPGKFCSYKADCRPYPPQGASIVCFHGQPKPDNCGAEWVANVWKVGGGGMADMEVIANTNREVITRNIISACKRDLPWLEIKDPHEGHAVIVAGGPSLRETIDEVKWRHSMGQTIIACNGAARFLNEHGICPDVQIVIDARPENVRFIGEATTINTFLASQCDPSLFDSADNVTVFHLNTVGVADIIPQDRTAHLISSGTTVGMAAIVVAYTQGYRRIHLHGFDSSYVEEHHAYQQKENDQDTVVEAVAGNRKFKCSPWMIKQVQDFQVLANELVADGVIITVAGDGLLPHVAKLMSFTGAKQ